jgi:hypothetical protein
MIKIFSRSLFTFFHDIFDNGKNGEPRYFHIFIGTNNRYAVAHPLENKSGSAILNTIKKFVEKFKPVKLISDNEAGFNDKKVLEYLNSQGVAVKFVHDQNHSTLGIIDRFTRTLRDMYDKKVISSKIMQKLIIHYNDTYHTSIQSTPYEMFSDHRLEKAYIDKCIENAGKQVNMKDFELEVGTFVRYILPKKALEKRRNRVSTDMYKIAGKQGNHYILMSEDGNVILKPRFMLIPVNKDEESKLKFAKTIEGKWTGVIDRIIEDVGKNKVRVAFKLPDGKEYIDTIPKLFIR